MSGKKKIRKAIFPVTGQGTFIYTIKRRSEFTIYITPDKQKMKGPPSDVDVDDMGFEEDLFPGNDEVNVLKNYISLTVGDKFAKFHLKITDATPHKEDRILKPEEWGEDAGIEDTRTVSYWFSYDRDALVLKYGKGHVMEETTLMVHDFLAGKSEEEKKNIRDKYKPFFNPNDKRYVVVHSTISGNGNPDEQDDKGSGLGCLIKTVPAFQFLPNPLIKDFPPIIRDSSQVTLFDLDRDQFMFSSSLPPACKELYDNIKNISFEYPEDPVIKLSDAIQYSIVTKGCTLYEKLREKDPKFGYLRVTLGGDKRTAPGIPYVLEIWPAGRGSPIHNHGGACAVIKVVYGRITVSVHNKFTRPPEDEHSEESKALKTFDLKDGQLTWIDPNWYQTHALNNHTDVFCATVQCYRYDYADTTHWPYFDYVGYVMGKEKYELEEFYPDSDFTFIKLRNIVLKEFQDHLENPE